MSEWTCRSCEGGFPEPLVRLQRPVCPWCGEKIGKSLAVSEPQRKLILRTYGLDND